MFSISTMTKVTNKLFFFSLICLILSSCKNPAEDKYEAITVDPKEKIIEFNSKGESFEFSERNSNLVFVGSKVTGRESGGFNEFSGKIDLVDKRPEKSQVFVRIEMESVFSESNGLASHLRTPDFFHVKKYPFSTFISSRIKPDNMSENHYSITGDFDFHGVRKSITFPAKIIVGKNAVKVESEFFIKRKDFNVNYAGRANDLIRDEVVLRLIINASPK